MSKKIIADKPAHPGSAMWGHSGMSIRETMAMHFMAAWINADCCGNSGMPYKQLAEWAIHCADALIEKLNNNQ